MKDTINAEEQRIYPTIDWEQQIMELWNSADLEVRMAVFPKMKQELKSQLEAQAKEYDGKVVRFVNFVKENFIS